MAEAQTHGGVELRGTQALWRMQPPISARLRAELNGESVMLAHLLCCRGYTLIEDIRTFLHGEPISHDPFALPDMQHAVERIVRAVDDGETVAVYGDFDCDGITATAALVQTLTTLGLRTLAHIPTRDDGHGLHAEALAALAAGGATLLVTADCGVTAIDEVQVAHGLGVDVIVTDHHEVRADGSLPACLVINPTRQDSVYPFRSLSGAGVAYKLAQALYARVPGALRPDSLLDLIALGTVADVVPLRDENRSLVQRGLSLLQQTRRPGLLALYEVAGVEPRRIDPTSVGFYLAPRINSANRMATPQLAYDLVTAHDAVHARELAQQLGEHNRSRQLLVDETVAGLIRMLGNPDLLRSAVADGSAPPMIVVEGDWPPGISGLLASKLVETYGLSAFVGSTLSDDMVPFSARGTRDVHIDEILEGCETMVPGGLFVGYGGHARAGGFRVTVDKLQITHDALAQYMRSVTSIGPQAPVLDIDAEVRLEQLNVAAGRLLRTLAPHGTDFPEPLFMARGVQVEGVSPLKGGTHARLRLRQGSTRLQGVMFHAPPTIFQLGQHTVLDVVFHFDLNEWNGTVRPELRLRDWRASAAAQ